MRDYLSDDDTPNRIAIAAYDLWSRHLCPAPANWLGLNIMRDDDGLKDASMELRAWPLPNAWPGVSAERQPEYDERKEHLRNTPAAKRFFSMEPLLGPIVADWLGDWVIAGGESGPKARPMHPDWARSLRDQCQAAGVPFFFKQWGEWAPSTPDQAKGNPRAGWRTIKAYPHVARADELYPEAGAAFVERVGKARAGRLLDGVEHNGMPEMRR
jgi:hypothetical protein